METYLIAGGRGFVGSYLCNLLIKKEQKVYVLTTRRNVPPTEEGVEFVYWNPAERYIDESFKIDHVRVINLAGAGIADKRWTDKRKKEILESRLWSLQTLYQAFEKKQIVPINLVSVSAIGYYGNGDQLFTEEDTGDSSFLSVVCQQWEQAALEIQKLNIPVAIGRLGIVLGKRGGAMKAFVKPMRFKVSGIPGDGNQIYSWIHVSDAVRILFYLSRYNKEGIYNLVAANPVSVNEIFKQIFKFKKYVFIRPHIPAFILKALLGEMSIELLKSTRVSNDKMELEDLTYMYPHIQECVHAILDR